MVLVICCILGIAIYCLYTILANETNANEIDNINISDIENNQETILKEEVDDMDNINLDNTLNEEEVIITRYKEMEQAMIDKDIDTLDEIIKDGTIFRHMSGVVQTKAEYLADIENGSLDYQSYTIENEQVTIDANKAIMHAQVTLTANAYGQQGNYPFNTTAYFEKENGVWLYRNEF